ncbi:actin-related protein T2-like [Mixophyes fleayi]|uniref:actin-related protein T2-like n=1 Tax=Mixophyes fleayi TaxID=3061075 RepID=UPI003F4DDA07
MSDVKVLDGDAVIIDNGSGFCKAGRSGERMPRSVIPTVIGCSKTKAKGTKREMYFGEEALSRKGGLCLKNPIEQGIITSWEDIEKLWNYIYDQELKMKATDQPLLMSEPALNPRYNREKMAEVMFETLRVPAMYVSEQATLALYALAQTTGVVLDCGDSVCQTVPVYEGYYLPHAVLKLNVSGREITSYLAKLLLDSGHRYMSSVSKEIVNNIKEELCYVALDTNQEMTKKPEYLDKDYALPDGKIIQIGSPLFRAPEILFHPAAVGLDSPGIHTMLFNSVMKCNPAIQKQLYGNILLSGGSTLLSGLHERVLKEIQQQAPNGVPIKITAPPDRQFSVWMGGSIVTSISSFKQMWVTSDDYEEIGPSVVHQRCF